MTNKKETVNVLMTIFLEVDASKMDKVKQLEHHAEYLLDLDNWPEIKSVQGAVVTEIK